MRIDRAKAVVFLVVFAAAIAFGVYTDLRWDDWWITFRASKNLPWGDGLTFTNGEPPIHSFTSPLGALIPAGLSALAGPANDELVVWLFRAICATFLGGAAVLLLEFAERTGASRAFALLLVAAVFVDAKTLTNTINGMETAILLFFLALALVGLTQKPGRSSIVVQGLAWSGLMWTRPDGFIWIIALALGFLIFQPRAANLGGRMGQIKEWLAAGMIVVVLYTPWLLWAWQYYGSPVPNTILAKGLNGSGGGFLGYFQSRGLVFLRAGTDTWKAVLMPAYAIAFGGGWPWYFVRPLTLIAFASGLLWLVPWLRSSTRAVSFAFLVGMIYLTFGMEFAFPWYYPPAALLAVTSFMLMLDQLAVAVAQRGALRQIPLVAAGGALGLVAVVTLTAANQLRFFQTVVYDQNNKAAGLWLAAHAVSERDTVFLEPLGYTGYYSNLKMYDYPGLSSREVMAARLKFPNHSIWGSRKIFADLIPYLKPDWLLLRRNEIAAIDQQNPQLLQSTYKIVKVFDVSDQIAAANVPGKRWMEFDQTFTIYQRLPSPPETTPSLQP